MPAGSRYLECALRALLPLHVGEVECGRRRGGAPVADETRKRLLPFQVLQEFRKRCGRINGDALCEERFTRVPEWYENSFDAAPLGGEHLREDTAHRAQRPVERELANKKYFFRERREVPCGDKIRECEREVVVRAFLLQVRR